MKALLTECFVVQHPSGTLPEKTLDAVTMAIAKYVEHTAEWIVTEFVLNNQAQASIAFTEIDWIKV